MVLEVVHLATSFHVLRSATTAPGCVRSQPTSLIMSYQSPSPPDTGEPNEPNALVACFYRDPWWEDLTAYINHKLRRVHPQAQPLSTTLVMNANLDKLKLFEIDADTQSASPIWDYLFWIASNYVRSQHQIYHKNVPYGLPRLYAICLWIDVHEPGHVLYHDDVRWLEVFLHQRLESRNHWARILGQPEIDFEEYSRRYVADIPDSLGRGTGVLLVRKPDLQVDSLMSHLMLFNGDTSS